MIAKRKQILIDAANHREQEVFQYQVNIDNYSRAIAEIEARHRGIPHMESFAKTLRDLLKSAREEQDKERVLLKVIRDQLEELGA